MRSVNQGGLILMVCLLIGSGCGSGHFSHAIDVTVVSEQGETPSTGFKIGLTDGVGGREGIAKVQLHAVNSNGVIHIDHRELSTLWAWQDRPPHLSFGLFIPSVSTNGYFWFRFEETSWLPWRGLKRGKVEIRPSYIEFARPGLRTVPAIRAEVLPSTLGGYDIKLDLATRVLRDGLAEP